MSKSGMELDQFNPEFELKDFERNLNLKMCVCVCVCVSPWSSLGRFGSCYAVQINALSIMKVYIENNNIQVELIRLRKKNIDFIHVYFCEARYSMQ